MAKTATDARQAWQSPVTKADAYAIAELLALTATAWLWPIDRLLPLARALRKLKWWRGDPYARSAPAEIPPPQFARRHSARSDRLLEARMQIVALHRPGRRWRPKVRWQGLEHLDAALERKAGAILCDGHFVYRQLISRMAFNDAGYRLTQLSRQGHGFSAIGGLDSPFATRFLNPLCRKIEDRFADRIWVGENTLDELREQLAINKIVSVLVWHRGRRTVEVPFFTTGRICIATGPVHLAHISGAPLIPVFTVRADDGIYDITVGPRLDIPRASEAPPGFKVDYAGIIKSYVEMLEPYVLRYPDQWMGWGTVTWEHGSALTSSLGFQQSSR